MSNDRPPKKKIDVEKIASGNPAINVSRFKEWRRKMDRLERLGFVSDERQEPPPPRRMQSFPIGPQQRRFGNLPN